MLGAKLARARPLYLLRRKTEVRKHVIMARKDDDLIAHILTVVRNEFQASERRLEERDRRIVTRLTEHEDALVALSNQLQALKTRVTALEAP